MMMDAEEEITWNLKGPKRMKKRRELNALVRNNIKYKCLQPRSSGSNPNSNNHKMNNKSNEFNMINCSQQGLDYSSTDDEQRDFFYSANKSITKE